jgi:uncharacterized glyoxalase superfamily metalloenzyme YdcJ
MADGSVVEGHLRVRFGEVEQRGVALTAAGRALYESGMQEIARLVSLSPGSKRADFAADVWAATFPNTEKALALEGLAVFTYRAADSYSPTPGAVASLRALIENEDFELEPIVYEDFLPRSAAGIFQSNLADDGTRDDGERASEYDIKRLSDVIGMVIRDPNALYLEQQEDSLQALEERLGIRVLRDVAT